MTEEQLLRIEANDFLDEKLKAYRFERKGYRSFYEDMIADLDRIFQPEHKMIFLDGLKKGTEKELEQHDLICYANTDGGKCTEHLYYHNILFFINQETKRLPQLISINDMVIPKSRRKVFLSYSHRDKVYIDEFKRHIPPMKDAMDIWHDGVIETGEVWRAEIEKAIQDSLAAVLFISADFFNSSFIGEVELPRLLNRAINEGATIINVFLGTCLTDKFPDIMKYQGVNSPDNPIKSIPTLEGRDVMWQRILNRH